MKNMFLILFTANLITACSDSDTKPAQENRLVFVPDRDAPELPEAITKPDFSVALSFINDYTKHCTSVDMDKWIPKHQLLSADFKNAYKALVDSMRKADPEMGLDFDPIFDAQDYPDQGFFVKKTDSINGYVTVEGKNWKDFTVLLKVVLKDGKSLVDGAGIINMPKDKWPRRFEE